MKQLETSSSIITAVSSIVQVQLVINIAKSKICLQKAKGNLSY